MAGLKKLRGGAFVGHPEKQERPRTKGSVSGNKGGDGARGKKPIATGLPGSPQGRCVKLQRECHCGGCK